MSDAESLCCVCPRRCHADRSKRAGACRSGNMMRIARAGLHFWEEPCISGFGGSGTIFFTGCPLACVYCQNIEISRGEGGVEIDGGRLREICFELKANGARNINLVTPTHFAKEIHRALKGVKKELAIPIICNTGGYESDETLDLFDEFVDIYLTDYKYALEDSAARLSAAKNYPEVALKAIGRMISSRPRPEFDESGMMTSGVIIRHLVIPGERRNSLAVIQSIGENFDKNSFVFSLMRQYTPIKGMAPPLDRRVTSFEYDSVRRLAEQYGFEGYYQGKGSSEKGYTPDFDLTGVMK